MPFQSIAMRLLLIILGIYIVYRLFFNLILPLVARHFMQKAAQSMEGAFRQQGYQAPPRKEGEIRIETPGETRNDGEYVDYTEVR